MSSSTRVFVLPITGRESEIDQLRKLITKAGCVVICDKAKQADFDQCIEDADVLVILICPESQNDPSINKLIEFASRQGKRVVGVWMPGAAKLAIPPAIHKDGDAVIVSDVDSIREAVCGGKPIWETPDGAPRPTPRTPRHKG